MPEDKDAKSLEMRLTRLENAIAKLSEGKKAVDVSAEEMKTYLKVRDAMEPAGCISECARCTVVQRCILSCVQGCYVCTRCNTECTCGPCACVAGGGGGYGGFSDLGR